MSNPTVHLLDLNVLIALTDRSHMHHQAASAWFDTPGLQWALCPSTEAGFIRYMTRPKTGELSMPEATGLLEALKAEPGHHFSPVTESWITLTKPFRSRIHGPNQVTDAYLLGIAKQEGQILVTFDKGVLHLAGDSEYAKHLRVLEA